MIHHPERQWARHTTLSINRSDTETGTTVFPVTRDEPPRQWPKPRELVAKAIWAERVRFAKEEQGIDLEEWGQKAGFKLAEDGQLDVAAMSNIMGEADAAIAVFKPWSLPTFIEASKAEAEQERTK